MTTQATITTSIPLSSALNKKVVDALQKKYPSSTVQLTEIVDPSVLGGVKLLVNGTEYDATIAGKLKTIAASLRTSKTV